MAPPRSSEPTGRPQIWVAIIGLLGGLGAALIANWRNIFPVQPPPTAVIALSSSATPSSRAQTSKPQERAGSSDSPPSTVSKQTPVAGAASAVRLELFGQPDVALGMGLTVYKAQLTRDGEWKDTPDGLERSFPGRLGSIPGRYWHEFQNGRLATALFVAREVRDSDDEARFQQVCGTKQWGEIMLAVADLYGEPKEKSVVTLGDGTISEQAERLRAHVFEDDSLRPEVQACKGDSSCSLWSVLGSGTDVYFKAKYKYVLQSGAKLIMERYATSYSIQTSDPKVSGFHARCAIIVRMDL